MAVNRPADQQSASLDKMARICADVLLKRLELEKTASSKVAIGPRTMRGALASVFQQFNDLQRVGGIPIQGQPRVNRLVNLVRRLTERLEPDPTWNPLRANKLKGLNYQRQNQLGQLANSMELGPMSNTAESAEEVVRRLYPQAADLLGIPGSPRPALRSAVSPLQAWRSATLMNL